ncbi:MAG: hypothetical protein RJA76_536 [Bacteroidota bacterium]|jgi:AraC-like DNA-binding protein
MYNLIPYISFLTSGVGLLFILFLLVRFHQYSKIYWLVGIVFAIVYIEFYTYALISKDILNMLFLFRSPNILRAIIPILLLFYVRGMLNPEEKIKPIAYLHFLFPLIVTIGVMPDLLLSHEDKTKILLIFFKKPDYLLLRPVGFFPSAFLQPFSMILVSLYSIYTLLIIYLTQKKIGKKYTYVNQNTLLWLKLLCIFIFVYFAIEYRSFLTLNFFHIFDSEAKLITCLLGIGVFSYFIATPNVQENLDGCIVPSEKESDQLIPSLESILPKLKVEYVDNKAANVFFQNILQTNCFLDAECDLSTLAKKLDLQSIKLSSEIKKYFGMSFSEFINRLKIHHFLVNSSQNSQFTLEANIYQSGFKNRSTFYAAFKKCVGLNPSFYLKEIKD